LALNGLLARRSIAKYDASKAVPDEAVSRALGAAIMAPNHFLSEPWRFYTCGPETKAKLCGLNEDKRKAAEAVYGTLPLEPGTAAWN
jgi:nitroreductase